ncbi:MAG: glycosyltransferase family 4 protein [Planctomycetes bacterium]|nr:glycosyltransferase family 4 protein [Planctomycetota bacterium]
MRICIFGDAQSVHLQRIVPGLIDRGVDVHVVTHKPAEISGVAVERFSVPPPSLTNLRTWHGRWLKCLREYMRRFDVVHVHFLADWGFTPEIMAEGCLVASPWGSDIVPPPGEGQPPRKLTDARVAMLRHAAMVTTWGPTFARTVAEFANIDESTIELLPLGVDLELFKPVERRFPRQSNLLRVGFYKGFREVYGASYLMRAMPAVVEVVPEVRFDMIGDGPQLAHCKMLAGLYGVEAHVNWVRRQPHRNIPNYLDGWDLTVIPSVCESFGAAALESSAMRVPVVASDVGGLPDTVEHGVTGLLVPPQAPEQLADAVITLLEDPELRQRMGAAGREMVEREYDWQAILDKWVATYGKARDRVFAVV